MKIISKFFDWISSKADDKLIDLSNQLLDKLENREILRIELLHNCPYIGKYFEVKFKESITISISRYTLYYDGITICENTKRIAEFFSYIEENFFTMMENKKSEKIKILENQLS